MAIQVSLAMKTKTVFQIFKSNLMLLVVVGGGRGGGDSGRDLWKKADPVKEIDILQVS